MTTAPTASRRLDFSSSGLYLARNPVRPCLECSAPCVACAGGGCASCRGTGRKPPRGWMLDVDDAGREFHVACRECGGRGEARRRCLCGCGRLFEWITYRHRAVTFSAQDVASARPDWDFRPRPLTWRWLHGEVRWPAVVEEFQRAQEEAAGVMMRGTPLARALA